jgi:ATP-dependent DNA helicase RecG
MLEKEGETRGSIYHLPGKQVSGSAQLFYENNELNSPDNELNSLDLEKRFSLALQSNGYSKMPKRLSPKNMRKIILEVCEDHFLSIKDLADLLERDSKALQEQYITPLLAEGLLELKYPDIKNHPDQAYRSKK